MSLADPVPTNNPLEPLLADLRFRCLMSEPLGGEPVTVAAERWPSMRAVRDIAALAIQARRETELRRRQRAAVARALLIRLEQIVRLEQELTTDRVLSLADDALDALDQVKAPAPAEGVTRG